MSCDACGCSSCSPARRRGPTGPTGPTGTSGVTGVTGATGPGGADVNEGQIGDMRNGTNADVPLNFGPNRIKVFYSGSDGNYAVRGMEAPPDLLQAVTSVFMNDNLLGVTTTFRNDNPVTAGNAFFCPGGVDLVSNRGDIIDFTYEPGFGYVVSVRATGQNIQ